MTGRTETAQEDLDNKMGITLSTQMPKPAFVQRTPHPEAYNPFFNQGSPHKDLETRLWNSEGR